MRIGIFAHDEENGIAALLGELARQDIFESDRDVRAVVLANGCRDRTAARAEAATARLGLEGQIEVATLAKGGKSCTWNAFVHDIAGADADALIFCDADIELPASDAMRRLVELLEADPHAAAATSRPVKDTVHRPGPMSLTARLITAGGGTLNDWRRAICGQLYALRGSEARALRLPHGLPVEDGYVRAMIVTDSFRHPDDLGRIATDEEVFHVYASERRLTDIVRHQVRVVIGGAVNSVIFAHVCAAPPEARPARARALGEDEGWLGAHLREALPDRRHGWVPWHFLFKRLNRFVRTPGAWRRPRKVLLAGLGFAFDAVVYVLAQIRMARGVGAGYW